MTKITNLTQLIEHEVLDLVSAEEQIVEALPKLIQAASSPELIDALNTHLKQSEEHIKRLEIVKEELSIKSSDPEKCKGMEGLLLEGEHMIQLTDKGSVRDSGIITASQRVEHYEMAGYMSLIRHLSIAEKSDIAMILKDSLDEEGEADELLAEIAETSVDEDALG